MKCFSGEVVLNAALRKVTTMRGDKEGMNVTQPSYNCKPLTVGTAGQIQLLFVENGCAQFCAHHQTLPSVTVCLNREEKSHKTWQLGIPKAIGSPLR